MAGYSWPAAGETLLWAENSGGTFPPTSVFQVRKLRHKEARGTQDVVGLGGEPQEPSCLWCVTCLDRGMQGLVSKLRLRLNLAHVLLW